jgi:hypothetical protein
MTRDVKKKKPKKPISEKVEVPGVRPATFKLVERGPGSYFVYRSSRKLGTARVEEDGSWTARFEDAEGERQAEAESGKALLRLVGGWLLLHEARELAAQPVETPADRPRKGKLTADEKLGMEFLRRSAARRVEEIDELIAGLADRVKRR